MAQAENFSFSQFTNQLRNPARGNQFRVDLNAPQQIRQFIPNASILEESLSFKTKSAAIPSLALDEIELNFRGRKAKLPGDRTLEPFVCDVFLTDGLPERKFFETWQDAIVGVDDASRNPDVGVNYLADATVHQLSQNGDILASYTFEGIWPSTIGEVSFDWESGDPLTLNLTLTVNNISTLGIR